MHGFVYIPHVEKCLTVKYVFRKNKRKRKVYMLIPGHSNHTEFKIAMKPGAAWVISFLKVNNEFHLLHAIKNQRGYLHASDLFISLCLPLKSTSRSINNNVILTCLTET